MKPEETEMICRKCQSRVYIEDGEYSCECYSLPLYLVLNGQEDFPDFWVDGDIFVDEQETQFNLNEHPGTEQQED